MIVMTELMKKVVMKKENVKMKLEFVSQSIGGHIICLFHTNGRIEFAELSVPEEVVNIVAIICPEVATCVSAIPDMLLIQKIPKNVLMSMNARHLDIIVHKFAPI
jgi:hypothetical protein